MLECAAVCRCGMWKAWPPAGSSASQQRPSYAGSSWFLIVVFSWSFLVLSILPLVCFLLCSPRRPSFYLFHSKSLDLAIRLVFRSLVSLFSFLSSLCSSLYFLKSSYSFILFLFTQPLLFCHSPSRPM